MKVVHIASGDLWAGAEVQVYNLAKKLNKCDGIQLFVILLNHGLLQRRLIQQGVYTAVFDETKLHSLRIFIRILAFLWNIKPHIVHTHRQKENVLGGLAAFLIARVKSIRTVHGAEERVLAVWQIRKYVFRALDWICGRYLQRKIVAVSAPLAQDLAGAFAAEKIAIVENAIDVDEVLARSAGSVELPGPADGIKFAFVGRLVAVKRVDMFIRAAKVMDDSADHKVFFYIFGEGPLAGKVRSLIHELKLCDRVFLMGFKKNMPVYLVRMNMLFITSDHEGLPISLLEALCLRVPVVAHAVGAIPKVLDSGRCGFLVYEQDVTEYAKAGQQYLTKKQVFLDMADEGFRQVREEYSIDVNVEGYRRIYRQTLSLAS